MHLADFGHSVLSAFPLWAEESYIFPMTAYGEMEYKRTDGQKIAT